ncbi:FUSC family protein [Paenibacillus sp. MWE-103]|uniref:FUSC family protein n=1 Tax=Paenibacillus artemisiicola TaxID=1172618 RepID=A0ABS3W4B8_9BACL|nr:FUSC family protein [Paenibacillus artemisiicola]MBO7743133.1 FUSC family protein [Paenibacillus artemisiicola]
MSKSDQGYTGLGFILKDTLQWSNEAPINYPQVIAGFIGMAGCISLGFYLNHLMFGLVSTFGVMITNDTSSNGTIKKHATELFRTMATGTVAIFIGIIIAGNGWVTGGLIVMISTLAALLGGISRSVAIASVQFVILSIIGSSMGDGLLHQDIFRVPAYFASGSLLGIILSVIAGYLMQKSDHNVSVQTAKLSYKQRFTLWRSKLIHFTGWKYTVRVALCMIAAQLMGIVFHLERSYWIGLTVAIVLKRDLAYSQRRIFQRGIGTAAGVLLGSCLLLWSLPQWNSVVVIGLLGALRPIFKNRSYAIYAMLMTPLMLMMFSTGSPVTAHLLEYRLLDTMIGCVLAYVLGFYIWNNASQGNVVGKT